MVLWSLKEALPHTRYDDLDQLRRFIYNSTFKSKFCTVVDGKMCITEEGLILLRPDFNPITLIPMLPGYYEVHKDRGEFTKYPPYLPYRKYRSNIRWTARVRKLHTKVGDRIPTYGAEWRNLCPLYVLIEDVEMYFKI